jgi:hypothetical protein
MRIIRISLTSALLGAFLTLLATPLLAVDKQEGMSVQMPDKLAFDNARTAVLIMDYQNDIVGMIPEKVQTPLLEKAGAILKEAHQAGLPVIYIVVRFRDGFPGRKGYSGQKTKPTNGQEQRQERNLALIQHLHDVVPIRAA